MTRFQTALGAALLGTTLMTPAAIAGEYNGGSGANLTALPSHAQPGECYARVKHDAQYATDSEIVVVEDGYQRLEVDQPQLQSRQEQVMIKEPSVRFEVRQPQYSTVSEQMMVRPAYEKLSVSAPKFSTVQETLQVSAPRVVWKRGNPGKLAAQGYNVLSTANGGYGSSGAMTGGAGSHGGVSHSGAFYGSTGPRHCGPDCEIWCLVEEPGKSISYNRKVVADPGRVQRQTVPAKFQTITKQVVSDPGGVREIPVPAQYRSVTVEDVISAGGERYVDVAPVTGKIAKKVLTAPERYEWMRVICSTGQVMGPASHSSSHVSSHSSSHSSSSATSYQSSQPNSGIIYGGEQTQTRRMNSYSGMGYGDNSSTFSSGNTLNTYRDKQPSDLIYGSSNTPSPTYGMDYPSSSAPRIYGGEGMNAHHSAGSRQ